MGPIIVADIMLFVFSIYIGIFFAFFHTSHPDMKVGFHVWEACYSKKTWNYGNKLAGKVCIILGVIFYGIIFPFLIYKDLSRAYLSIALCLSLIVYFLILFPTVKIILRKKFKLKDSD